MSSVGGDGGEGSSGVPADLKVDPARGEEGSGVDVEEYRSRDSEEEGVFVR